ncbi:hypothetical protein CDL12_30077 [Handroanthus impetiginosus]|uniref:RNase H type-1 domain-containing protein n=1 Tax=Handroanthus impetiginosus TaxID=429701 RepID=A0A2G9FWM7_9LAMI|nr:hypothetical protein CDL12_30077 [Handroanthus impetiginosus]
MTSNAAPMEDLRRKLDKVREKQPSMETSGADLVGPSKRHETPCVNVHDAHANAGMCAAAVLESQVAVLDASPHAAAALESHADIHAVQELVHSPSNFVHASHAAEKVLKSAQDANGAHASHANPSVNHDDVHVRATLEFVHERGFQNPADTHALDAPHTAAHAQKNAQHEDHVSHEAAGLRAALMADKHAAAAHADHGPVHAPPDLAHALDAAQVTHDVPHAAANMEKNAQADHAHAPCHALQGGAHVPQVASHADASMSADPRVLTPARHHLFHVESTKDQAEHVNAEAPPAATASPPLVQQIISSSNGKYVNVDPNDALECPLKTHDQDFTNSSTEEAENSNQNGAHKLLDEKTESKKLTTQSAFVVRRRCSAYAIRCLKRLTGFCQQTLPITYLGAPLYVGNQKEILYDDILAKVIHPTISVLNKLEKVFNRFLWGDYGGHRTLHWAKWDDISYKYGEGGFGVRKMKDVVDSFSCKLWWRFRNQNSFWAKFLKAKYIEDDSSLDYPIPAASSAAWRRLNKWKTVTDSHIYWKLGRGNVSFWKDHWCGMGALNNLVDNPHDLNSLVSEYWDDTGQWNVEKLSLNLPAQLVDAVLEVTFVQESKDTPIWKLSPHGNFTLSSIWDVLRTKPEMNSLLKDIWLPFISPTISIFMWRLIKNKVPVDTRMQQKGFSLASKCYCCNSIESVSHLFVTSNFAHDIWGHFSEFFNIPQLSTGSLVAILSSWKYSMPFVTHGHIRQVIPILICWHIWEARNDAKYRYICFSARRIIFKVRQHIQHIILTNKLTFRHWRGDTAVAQALGQHIPLPPPRKSMAVWWSKPKPGEWKLNTDGAAKRSTCRAGAGGILHDHTGMSILAFTHYLGLGSSLEAELTAIHRGLYLCVAKGFTKIWIEMDSQLAVQLIQSDQHGSWKIHHLLDGIRQLMRHFPIRISHIFREGNRPADFLANMACDLQYSGEIKPQDFTRTLIGLLRMDRWGLPSFRFS